MNIGQASCRFTPAKHAMRRSSYVIVARARIEMVFYGRLERAVQ